MGIPGDARSTPNVTTTNVSRRGPCPLGAHYPVETHCSKNPNVYLHPRLALNCRPLPPTTSTAPFGVPREPQAHHIQNPLPTCLLGLPTPARANRSSSSLPHLQIPPCKSCRLRSPSEHPEPGTSNPSSLPPPPRPAQFLPPGLHRGPGSVQTPTQWVCDCSHGAIAPPKATRARLSL